MSHKKLIAESKLPDNQKENLLQNTKHRRWLRFGLIIIIVPFLVWILWETYIADNFGFREKTLWDWMELMVIPLFLAFAAFLLNKSQRETELKIAEIRRLEDQEFARQKASLDRELARDTQQQVMLEAYFERMTNLLLDKNLRISNEDDEVRSIARTWTFTVLRGLDGVRKSLVLQFLYESDLIGHHPIIDMSFTDLRNINLEYAKLDGINLPKANLRGANLRSASLQGANFYLADLDGADLSWANLIKANLCAGLSKVDLGAARLDGAILRGADLSGANLLNTSLVGADLRQANLKYINEALGDFSPENLLRTED